MTPLPLAGATQVATRPDREPRRIRMTRIARDGRAQPARRIFRELRPIRASSRRLGSSRAATHASL